MKKTIVLIVTTFAFSAYGMHPRSERTIEVLDDEQDISQRTYASGGRFDPIETRTEKLEEQDLKKALEDSARLHEEKILQQALAESMLEEKRSVQRAIAKSLQPNISVLKKKIQNREIIDAQFLRQALSEALENPTALKGFEKDAIKLLEKKEQEMLLQVTIFTASLEKSWDRVRAPLKELIKQYSREGRALGKVKRKLSHLFESSK